VGAAQARESRPTIFSEATNETGAETGEAPEALASNVVVFAPGDNTAPSNPDSSTADLIEDAVAVRRSLQ